MHNNEMKITISSKLPNTLQGEPPKQLKKLR